MNKLKVISLGLGQPSTVLYFMSSLGEIERADYAIFADPGAENKKTYIYLEWLLDWVEKNNGIPIIVTGKKTICNDLINGFHNNSGRSVSIPAYTKDNKGNIGMLRRQCTDDYKAFEVNKAIRGIYGLRKFQHTPATEIWLGITIEEQQRMKFPRYHWQTFVYPYCNTLTHDGKVIQGAFNTYFNRSNCIAWLQRKKFPVPPFSACFFCPYQSNRRWAALKRNRPDEWQQAVDLDAQIRDASDRGIVYPVYLHRQGIPLSQVNLQEHQPGLFIAECEGFCGI